MTAAISGVHNALQQHTKSKGAHMWAEGLHRPCYLGRPQHSRDRDEIRSILHVGGLATPPLPPGGSGTLQSGGPKSELTHDAADWLHHPCHIRGPKSFIARDKITSGPKMGGLATSPLPSRGSHCFRPGAQIRSGPHVCGVATSPLPSGGTPMQKSGGQHQKWPKCVRNGCSTRAL